MTLQKYKGSWEITTSNYIANKMDNLEEMDKFLEKHNFWHWTRKKHINRPITSTEIETVIKNLPKTKAQDQMASQANSIKHLEKS